MLEAWNFKKFFSEGEIGSYLQKNSLKKALYLVILHLMTKISSYKGSDHVYQTYCWRVAKALAVYASDANYGTPTIGKNNAF